MMPSFRIGSRFTSTDWLFHREHAVLVQWQNEWGSPISPSVRFLATAIFFTLHPFVSCTVSYFLFCVRVCVWLEKYRLTTHMATALKKSSAAATELEDGWEEVPYCYLCENQKDAQAGSAVHKTSDNEASAVTLTTTAKWIQCEDKTSEDYKAFFVEGWVPWQPYLWFGSKNKHKTVASLHTQKWLTSSGWRAIPKTFGEYAIGVIPPDSTIPRDVTPKDGLALEEQVLIVNHGIVAGAAAQANTLNKRLMTYGTKVKPYEYAIGAWMKMGFRVFVKWREMKADDEMKGLSSKSGAAMRKTAETNALKKWKFFLNVAEQRSVKGPGASLKQDPYQLVLREEKNGGFVTAAKYDADRVVQSHNFTVEQTKEQCMRLLRAPGKADAVKIEDTIAFLMSLK